VKVLISGLLQFKSQSVDTMDALTPSQTDPERALHCRRHMSRAVSGRSTDAERTFCARMRAALK
jgi:hypothetical protein